MNYYELEALEVLKKLKTSLNGLSQREVLKRREKYGKNELPKKKQDSIIKIFFKGFLAPIILILLGTIIFSFFTQEYLDMYVVIAIILIDLILGTIQEYSAIKRALSLENIIKVKCKVVREGKEYIIDSSELVIGDIVYLESGNKISADLRIIDSYNLMVDESVLTGESTGVYKNNKVIKRKVSPEECTNMLYAGCNIITGRCTGVVARVGNDSEIGKIAESVVSLKETKSPLTIRIEKFSKQISVIVLVIALFLTILLVIKGYSLASCFMLVVALLVSALPEGLPLALTMATTIASSRMLKEKVIVKKLNSVESLGSCTLIASDKTGTLTINKQTAKIIVLPNNKKFEITGSGYNSDGHVVINDEKDKKEILELIKLGLINNEAHLEITPKVKYDGDSIDVAFLSLALKMKVKDNVKKIFKIPYESINKYSAVFYKEGNETYCTVKGSVEKILEFSKVSDKDLIKRQNEELAKNGYRVIALAFAKVKNKEEYLESDIHDLTFKGLVGFIDPVRDDCYSALKNCRKAGVKVVMITGDHPLTAYKIAKDLGIVKERNEVGTGSEVSKKLKEGVIELDSYISKIKVFARVSPLEKLEIVNSFKRQGEFVAVTGDGVNDAPALKSANLGIAMGSGTDVSLEVSNMILIDDKFASIVKGIKEGRCAYSNIRKVIYMLISCGFAEVLFFMLAIFFNLEAPLLAIQLLWLNIVTDGLQDLSLSLEKSEVDIMTKKPRSPKENLFDKNLINEVLLSGFSMGIIVFIVYYYLIKILNLNINIVRGYIMVLMVFMQNIHVLNCRSEDKSIFDKRLKRNPYVIFSILSSIILQIIIMEVPFLSHIFKMESISIFSLIILFIISLSILLIMELYKSRKSKNNY